MKRRSLIVVAGAALAVPGTLFAQSGKRVYRIAFLEETTEKARPHDWAALRDRLRELVVAGGGDLVFEARYAQGQLERLPALAAELVATKPDIIVTSGTPTARAAVRATGTIPIVFIGPGDPVGTGLVASLSRPGGNATGYSTTAPETLQKSLEMLRELVPGLKKFAFLTDPTNPATNITYFRLEESARKLKLSSQMLDGLGHAALQRSFDTIHRERVQGLLVGTAGSLLDHREQIVQLAARDKLPTVYGRREYVDAGGLVSYGIHRKPLFARAAELAHRILRGAKPAEIPVEQIATIQTVLNLKAARALGLKIPDAFRLRADEVIE